MPTTVLVTCMKIKPPADAETAQFAGYFDGHQMRGFVAARENVRFHFS